MEKGHKERRAVWNGASPDWIRAKQDELAAAFGSEEEELYEQLSKQILQGPRNERTERFWKCVSRYNKQNSDSIGTKNPQGEEIARDGLTLETT